MGTARALFACCLAFVVLTPQAGLAWADGQVVAGESVATIGIRVSVLPSFKVKSDGEAGALEINSNAPGLRYHVIVESDVENVALAAFDGSATAAHGPLTMQMMPRQGGIPLLLLVAPD